MELASPPCTLRGSHSSAWSMVWSPGCCQACSGCVHGPWGPYCARCKRHTRCLAGRLCTNKGGGAANWCWCTATHWGHRTLDCRCRHSSLSEAGVLSFAWRRPGLRVLTRKRQRRSWSCGRRCTGRWPHETHQPRPAPLTWSLSPRNHPRKACQVNALCRLRLMLQEGGLQGGRMTLCTWASPGRCIGVFWRRKAWTHLQGPSQTLQEGRWKTRRRMARWRKTTRGRLALRRPRLTCDLRGCWRTRCWWGWAASASCPTQRHCSCSAAP